MTRRKARTIPDKGRKTMYRGIEMRSRLEADFAAFLDQNKADWDYEPMCFAGPDGQWLPDFTLCHDGATIYFEIKPGSLLEDEAAEIDPLLERMSVVWLTEPDAILQLTFWVYQKPWESYSFIGIPPDGPDDMTWWCGPGAGNGKMTPWVGMGQLIRMCEVVQREQEAAGEKSL